MTREEKLAEAKRLYKTANADQRYVLKCLFPELKEDEVVPHWISVEDELPPILENVLVCRKGNEVRVAWLSNTNWHSIDGYPLNNNITHWMPIPQPPKP